MVIGNKSFVMLYLMVMVHSILYSQQVICHDTCSFYRNNDLYAALSEYLSRNAVQNRILLVDYAHKDTISHFRITGSAEILEIFFKKPDCFLTFKENIVYLYTENYAQQKDSLWLQEVFYKTIETLNYPNIEVLWKNDSILKVDGPAYLIGSYSPAIIEFTVQDGEIIKKVFFDKMLYPDIGKPKGVRVFRWE